ncbi:MAG: 4Fe-4S dicluster domain-containing protein [Anaerolineaceae bacterium]|nr:4Fe-4S dicluster domain-containing protein [Anaerolineaceae bacterium]
MTTLEILLITIFSILTLGCIAFALTSVHEKQKRAAYLTGFGALTALVLGTSLFFSPTPVQIGAGLCIGAFLFVSLIWFLWPAQHPVPDSPPPNDPVDERTIMFARARLKPGSHEFKVYYNDHPSHLEPDNAFRQNPGLLSEWAGFYDPFLASSPDASFFLTEALSRVVDGPIAPKPADRGQEKNTAFIKGLARYHGANDVGICELQPYHVYSHIGRGEGAWGAPIDLTHKYAIAFTVEMSHEMILAAPRMPAVMESARQYVEAGKIAVILAAAIRNLGYPARAHIDGNYRVIAPLVARDAGLGENGRMGLLMTPRLGPRARIAVVTTDLPLVLDKRVFTPSVIDFCDHCQKCVTTCPSHAIPEGPRTPQPDGSLRWQINAEQCFTYWTKIGTDCGRCMAVCPYAHPDTPLHNLIRLGVTHSANFRKAAVKMDDLFYGSKPSPHSPPEWIE